VQDQPNQSALSMGDDSDGLVMAKARDHPAIDDFEKTALTSCRKSLFCGGCSGRFWVIGCVVVAMTAYTSAAQWCLSVVRGESRSGFSASKPEPSRSSPPIKLSSC
jgi:hypothetical protein